MQLRLAEEFRRQRKGLSEADAQIHRHRGAPVEDAGDGRPWAPICSANSPICLSPRNSRSSSPGLAGLCIIIASTPSVIVLIIDQYRVFSFKSEGQSPIPIDGDGPMALQLTLQRMPAPPAPIDIGRSRGQIESRRKDFEMIWASGRHWKKPRLTAKSGGEPGAPTFVMFRVTWWLRRSVC